LWLPADNGHRRTASSALRPDTSDTRICLSAKAAALLRCRKHHVRQISPNEPLAFQTRMRLITYEFDRHRPVSYLLL
jgi:hypothetical protein